jgi:hypothetical protein
MTSYGSSTQKKDFTTTGPTEVKATVLPGETAEVKTTTYSAGGSSYPAGGSSYSAGGSSSATGYTADLGDRTEGNQNWMETGGEMQERTPWSDKAREVGHEASDKARELGYATEQKAAGATQTLKETASKTGEVLKEKWEQGKEKRGEVMEAGKEKLQYGKEKAAYEAELGKEKLGQTWEQGKVKMGEAMEAGKEKLQYGKDKAAYEAELGKEKAAQMYQSATTSKPTEATHPGMLDRVKETVETATHNIAESLEHAREKAREVFTGASPYGKEQPTYGLKTDQPVTEVRVKTEPASGTVNRVQVDSNTETKIQ